MSAQLDRLREQAKHLFDDAHCILGTELLEPDGDDDSAAIGQAWDEEILRRVEEIKNGTVKMIPAEQVFAELDEMLRCRQK